MKPMTRYRKLTLTLRLQWGALALLTLTAATASEQLAVNRATRQPTTDINLSGTHWTGTLAAARLPATVPLLDGTGALNIAGGGGFDSGQITFSPDGSGQIAASSLYAGEVITQGAVQANGGFSTDNGRIGTSGMGDLSITGTLTNAASFGILDLTRGGSLIIGSNIDTTGGGSITTGTGNITTGTGNIDTTGGGSITTGGNIDTTGGGSVTTGGGNIYLGTGGDISTAYNGGRFDSTGGGGYVVTNGYGAPTDSSAPIGSLYCDQDPDGASGHVLWVMEPGGWAGK